MRMSCARRMLLAVFATAFVLLLCSGAPRLVGHAAHQPIKPPAQAMQAALCAPVITVQQPDAQAKACGASAQRLPHAALPQTLAAYGAPCADANGNMLCGGQSYLRAVYRAFPLGDGFA